MRALQALLVDAAEQGLISRQEAVSMLPPLFLKVCTRLLRACCEQVQAGDTVLDLCVKRLLLIRALRGCY
jgi:16S rRNA C967 or C1407 C5-methylase (RsmB/RsmF family)